ncbi:MAG TPA: TlpA disulfide reductase family protein [Bryobacterales bacterium]|nr:TlpA disulfide reductase family protein [Bryobacterales bacterium]
MASNIRATLFGGVIAVLLATMIYRVVPYLEIHNVEVGDKAPGFELADDSGQGVNLSDFRGKYVLLNFWATWCPPCVEEMPSLSALHERLKDQGLVVLGVSVDESEAEYKRFLDRARLSFPTVRDPERSVSSRYGTVKYPETYLINPEGVVIRKYINWQDWNRPEIVNYLNSLL